MHKIIKSNILIKFLISYAVVLILPMVILLCLINIYILPMLQNEIIQVNREKIIKAQIEVDKRFKDMENITWSLSNDGRLYPFAIKQNYYSSIDCMNDLRMHQKSNDFISDILYYIRGDNQIYTTMQVCETKTFIEKIYNFDNEDYSSFNKLLNTFEYNEYRKLKKVSDNNEYIAFFYPIISNQPYADVIFVVNLNEIKNLTESIFNEYDENIMITDSNYRLITSSNENGYILDKQLNDIKGSINGNNNESFVSTDGKYIISVIKSYKNNWNYISVVEKDKILKKITDIKVKVVYTLLIIFLIGLVIILFVSYINYSPIYNIKKLISQKLSLEIDDKKEIESIGSIFNEIIDTNEKLKTSIDIQKPIVRQYVLNELIKGKSSSIGELIKSKSDIGIKLLDRDYCVIVIEFSSTGIINEDNIISELNGSINKIYGENIDLYCVNQYEKNKEILIVSLNKNINEKEVNLSIIEYFCKEIKPECKVGIGNFYNDILMIAQSFLESIQALKYCNNHNKGNVVFFNEIGDTIAEDKAEGLYPYKLLEDISNHVRRGEIDEVKNGIENIYKYTKSKDIPEIFMRCMTLDIFSMLVEIMIEMNIDYRCMKDEYMDILSFDNSKDADQIYREISTSCSKICNYICEQVKKKNELINNILKYIEENYNHDFSVDKMADYFNITVPYISQTFKDKTGDTITNYIWEIRLLKTKEMLVNTEMPIKQIIDNVGYIDISSFIRKFKNSEGVTPGLYRKEHRNKKT